MDSTYIGGPRCENKGDRASQEVAFFHGLCIYSCHLPCLSSCLDFPQWWTVVDCNMKKKFHPLFGHGVFHSNRNPDNDTSKVLSNIHKHEK